MPYPNSGPLNIIISQTSGSLGTSNQYPFEERIISGSRLILQTTIDGTLTGSSDLNINSITASNISASGYISASNLRVETSIVDGGTLTVLGNTNLGDAVSDLVRITGSANISGSFGVVGTSTFSGLVSASAGLTASAIQDAGTLTVVGTSTLAGLTATTATFSGLVSASAGLTASAIQDAGTLTVVGSSTLGNVFATNITASNISASGFISASNLRVETSIVDGGTLTVLGNTVLGDTVSDTTRITGSASISGSLSVVGTTTLQSTTVTNLTASNISSSGFITSSTLYVDTNAVINGDLTVNGGDLILSSSATNVLLKGNQAGALIIKDSSSDYISILTSPSAGNVTFGTNPTVKITNANNATSYNVTTAALQVDGGARISKDTWISGSLNVAGDFTVFGSSSVVYISSSTVIINDNIIQLNAFFPYERYSGFEVFDSGSNQRSASLLWDGKNDNWITVDQNNSASNIIHGPTSSFSGDNITGFTTNAIPKAFDSTGITDSKLSDDGTTLRYTGNVISASSITASNGTVTFITGALVTYVTGSFTTLTIATGSNPGAGAVPTHPTASGMAGQINVDNNFIYVYTNNIWKRVPISNWSL